MSKIEEDKSDGKLSLHAAKILVGIHEFCTNPVDEPSKLDIHLLSVVYYQVNTGTDSYHSVKTAHFLVAILVFESCI